MAKASINTRAGWNVLARSLGVITPTEGKPVTEPAPRRYTEQALLGGVCESSILPPIRARLLRRVGDHPIGKRGRVWRIRDEDYWAFQPTHSGAGVRVREGEWEEVAR